MPGSPAGAQDAMDVTVELSGGIADRRTGSAGKRDTSAVILSYSKGVLAVCVHGNPRPRELAMALGRVVGA